MEKSNVRKVLLITIAAALLTALAGVSWAVELLTNPDFEAGVLSSNCESCGIENGTAGWIYSSIDPNPPVDPETGVFYPCSGFWNGGVTGWGGGTRVHGGLSAARVFHYGGLGAGFSGGTYTGYRWDSIRQQVSVVAGANYTASAWVYVWHDTAYNIGSESFFQFKVEEIDGTGAVVATHVQPVTVINEWANPTVAFETTANTAQLRFLLISKIYNNCNITHVTYDDCSLQGPSPLSSELLANSSFENGMPLWNGDSCGGEATVVNWTYSTINPFGDSLCSGFWDSGATGWSGGTRVHDGASGVRWFTYGYTPGFVFASLRQIAAVASDQDYTASAWIYIWHDWATYPTMDPGFFVKLDVQEFDTFDTPVGSPRTVSYNNDPGNTNVWLNPKTTFHTSAQTAKVEFKLSGYMPDPFNVTHVNYDQCSLTGPSPVSLQGTVTSGGNPLAGVTVEAGTSTDETAADGSYSMSVPTGTQGVIIRAAKTGYFTQKKFRTLQYGANTVDFDLAAVGNNLLKNPGFDNNSVHTPYETVPDYWIASPASGLSKESMFLDTGYGGYFHNGEEAVDLVCSEPPGEATISQTVSVLPNSQYTASAWAHAAGNGSGWFTGSNQQAALVVQQLNKGGQVIDEHKEYLTDFAEWQNLIYSFDTLSNTVMVRISGWANMTDDWNDTLGRAVFDDFQLNGAAGTWVVPPLYGVVKSGTTMLADARVYSMTTGTSTVSDADGTWNMSPASGQHWLRTLKPGYYTQRQLVTSPSANPVMFDLVEKGSNLLVNPGFDDGVYEGGWVEEQSTTGNCMRRGEYNFIVLSGLGPGYYTSGQEAICLFNADTPAPGSCWYWQSVPVVGGQTYTARVKTKISMPEGTASMWGYPFDDQVSGLLIKEYDASGNLVLAHELIKSMELAEWEQLVETFQAQPATTSIKIGPYVYMMENARDLGWARATFDDVELNGQLGAFGLSGTVKSGATALAGATVRIIETDGPTNYYTTDANGHYTATVSYGASYSIFVSRGGYYPQTKTSTVTGVTVVDFDLVSAACNLLFNPNFDDASGYLSGGWTPSGSVWPETNTAQWGLAHFFSVPQALYMRGPGVGSTVTQDVPVLPNSNYTAKVQFLSCTDSRYGSVWGVDPNQVGALTIQELDAQKNPIGVETRVYADVTLENRDQWKELTASLQTTANTAYIRVGGYAYLVDNYDGNLARAIFDNFYLCGPAVPGMGLADVKGLTSGSTARITGKIVTSRFNGYFYAQEPDRSSGIRIYGFASPGDVVDVFGTFHYVSGEPVMSSANVVQRSIGGVPDPLGTVQKALDMGLSGIGLYMTVWGLVDSVDETAGTFTISDGSGQSLKVYGSAQSGKYVSVTGAIGAEQSGEVTVPVMRAVTVVVQAN